MNIPTAPCARCEHPTVSQRHFREFPEVRAHARRRVARGMCGRCYQQTKGTDAAYDYPRQTMPQDELLDDWEILRGEGYTVVHAAPRLGVTLDALSQALCRGKRAGDPRVGQPSWVGFQSAVREARAS